MVIPISGWRITSSYYTSPIYISRLCNSKPSIISPRRRMLRIAHNIHSCSMSIYSRTICIIYTICPKVYCRIIFNIIKNHPTMICSSWRIVCATTASYYFNRKSSIICDYMNWIENLSVVRTSGRNSIHISSGTSPNTSTDISIRRYVWSISIIYVYSPTIGTTDP